MPHSSRKGLLVLLYLGLIACLGTFYSPAVAAPARRRCHLKEGNQGGVGRPEPAVKMAGKRKKQGKIYLAAGSERQLWFKYRKLFYGLTEW